MSQCVSRSRALRIRKNTSHVWGLVSLLITLTRALTSGVLRPSCMHVFAKCITCLSTVWRRNNIFSLIYSLRLYSRGRVKPFLHAHGVSYRSVRITRSVVSSSLADVGRRVGVQVDHRSRLRANLHLAIIGKVSCGFSWKRLARLTWLSPRDILFSSWRLSVMSLFNNSSRCGIVNQSFCSCCWRSSFVVLVRFNYMFQVRVTVWQTLTEELLTVRRIGLRNVMIL